MNYRYDLFKWRRQQLGYTFGQVSKKTKLAKNTVIKSERRTGNPNAKTMKTLAQFYGLDPSSPMNFSLTKDQFPCAVLNGPAR